MSPTVSTAITLDQVPLGRQARVLAIHGAAPLMQRLMEMGILEGDIVELLAIAPIGDPLEFRVGDYRLSLRRAEAAHVEAELLP